MSYQYPEAINLSPSGSPLLTFGTGDVTFSWDFVPRGAAPSETQASYIVFFRFADDDSQIVLANGSSGAYSPTYWGTDPTVHSVTIRMPSQVKGRLIKWFVEVRGTAAQGYGPGDSDYQYFTMDDTIIYFTISTPAGGTPTVGTPSPLIGWTYNAGSGAQQTRRVVFKRASDNVVVHDSGELATTSQTYQPPACLDNSTTYLLSVTLTNASGSTTSSKYISTDWSAPAAPSFTATYVAADGYVDLSWTNASKDSAWTAWRVYRRDSSGAPWVQIGADFTIDQGSYDLRDYTPAIGSPQYAVVQAADRSGYSVESARTPTTVSVTVNDKYTLICPANPTLNVTFDTVTQDDPTEGYETQTIHVIGRGRKVDYGDRLGWQGNFAAQVYDRDGGLTARQVRLNLQAMKALKTRLYLRNPFGDLWQVNVGDLAVKRMAGVGQREFYTVSFTYEELSE